MISFRNADLFTRRKELATFEVVIDFHYDEDVKKYYCIINDPSGNSEQFKSSIPTDQFNLGIFSTPFDINQRDFKGCSADFFGHNSNTMYGSEIHRIIDEYKSSLEDLGFEIKLIEDTVYKKPYEDRNGSPITGSRYLVFWRVSPKN